MPKAAERHTTPIADPAALCSLEIAALYERKTALEEQEYEVPAAERDAIIHKHRDCMARIDFLLVSLSYQTATSLDGALAQCVRLIAEIGNLSDFAQCDMDEYDKVDFHEALCRSQRLAYSALRVLEQASGSRRETYAAEWMLEPGKDPFTAANLVAPSAEVVQ